MSLTQTVLDLHTDLKAIGDYKKHPTVVRALISVARSKVNEIDGYLGDIEAELDKPANVTSINPAA